jgi:DNA primase
MPDDRDVIRSKVDLVQLIGERVRLTRSGKKWKGLCPFHPEKSPSFYVDPDLGLFHCFGCHVGGDLFAWVMRTENVDFREALTLLAERAGIELSKQKSSSKSDIPDLLEAANTFFLSQLNSHQNVKAYLENRGIPNEIAEDWELGYAPNEGTALASYLKTKGFKLKDASEAGLVSGDSDQGYGDFFRDRLMFPIRDDRGRLVAFGGRSLGSENPKYLNSRDSFLFRKSETLFGLHRARNEHTKNQPAILVEGYFDVIACHRAGLTTAIAPLGTSFTSQHANKISRWFDNIMVLFDGDDAGRKAAQRVMTLLQPLEIEVRFVLLQDQEDPDTILKEKGPEGLRQCVQNAVSNLRFTVNGVLRDFNATPGISDHKFWDTIIQLLSQSDQPLEADSIADEIVSLHPNAKRDRIGTLQSLKSAISGRRKKKTRTRKQSLGFSTIETNKALRPAERIILRAALSLEFRNGVWNRLEDPDLIYSESARDIADALINFSKTPTLDAPGDIVAKMSPNIQNLIATLEPPDDPYRKINEPVTHESIEEAIAVLEQDRKRRHEQTTKEKFETVEDKIQYLLKKREGT